MLFFGSPEFPSDNEKTNWKTSIEPTLKTRNAMMGWKVRREKDNGNFIQ
jgi:hypothetical protein